MKEENDIEQLFRSSFEDFEMTPPAEVKAGIDKAIARRRFRGIWLLTFLVLFLGSAAAFTYYLVSRENHSSSSSSSSSPAPARSHADNSSSYSAADRASDQQSGRVNTVTSANANDRKQTASSSVTESASAKTTDAYAEPASDKIIPATTRTAKKAAAAKETTTARKKNGRKKASSGKGKRSGKPGKQPIAADTGEGYNPEYVYDGNVPGIIKEDEPKPVKTDTLSSASGVPADAAAVQPADSSGMATAADSIPVVVPPAQGPPPASGEPKWMLSAYAGPNFGLNSKSNGTKAYSERGSYLLSLEIQRYFGQYSVSSGLSYGKRGDLFTTSGSFNTITYLGTDSVAVYDPQGDSILYYTYFEDYDTAVTTWEERRLNTVTTFGIPLYAGRHFQFGTSSWGLQVNAGATFNFHTIKYRSPDLDLSVLTMNKFGINGVLRLHGTYEWNKVCFSAGVTAGWDFKPAVTGTGFDRKRYYLTPQLGIHWKF